MSEETETYNRNKAETYNHNNNRDKILKFEGKKRLQIESDNWYDVGHINNIEDKFTVDLNSRDRSNRNFRS